MFFMKFLLRNRKVTPKKIQSAKAEKGRGETMVVGTAGIWVSQSLRLISDSRKEEIEDEH